MADEAGKPDGGGEPALWQAPALVAWLLDRLGEDALLATVLDLACRGLLSVAPAEDGELRLDRCRPASTGWEARVFDLLFRASSDPEREMVGSAAWRAWAHSRPEHLERWWDEWTTAVAAAGTAATWGERHGRRRRKRRAAQDDAAERWRAFADPLAADPGRVQAHPDALDRYGRIVPLLVALGSHEALVAALDSRLSPSERAQVAGGWFHEGEQTLAGSLETVARLLPPGLVAPHRDPGPV